MKLPQFIRFRRLTRKAQEYTKRKEEKIYEKRIEKLVTQHREELKNRSEEYTKNITMMDSVQKKETKRMESYYKIKEERLDALIEEMKKKEYYLNKQIDHINDFLSKAMLVVKQTSKEYKTVLNDVARATDAQYGIEKLHAEYKTLMDKIFTQKNLIN